MASNMHTYFFSLFLYFLLPFTFSTNHSSPPKALVLPISKHSPSLQYITSLSQRTPLVSINLVVNLNGPFLWVSCDHLSYRSSSYRSAQCRSSLCSLTHEFFNPRPQCSNHTCMLLAENVFTSKVSSGNLSIDVLSLPATDGLNPTSIASVPRFIFLCAPDFLLQGLASGTKGIAGLGHSQIGLPTQLATKFNFTRKFAICLSPSTDFYGVIFFGDGPYALLPGIDISKLLIYTPLAIVSQEYHIKVKSIRINGKKVPLNSSSSIRTKISTIDPYTKLESSIYNSLTTIFIQEAMAANATRVKEVAPFGVCFSTKISDGSLSRPDIPFVDLMLQDVKVFWRIFETNSMVPVGNDTACLGFLDGGLNPGSSIIIGGYQLEDNFLQFDLVSSRLGFTSSLLLRETSCGNFNFTSTI